MTNKVKMLDAIHFEWKSDDSQLCSLPNSENQNDDCAKIDPRKHFDDLWLESNNKTLLFTNLIEYAELAEFVKKEGHFNPPRNSSIRNWVHYQRRLNRQHKLSETRTKLLNAINFPWDSVKYPKIEPNEEEPADEVQEDEEVR